MELKYYEFEYKYLFDHKLLQNMMMMVSKLLLGNHLDKDWYKVLFELMLYFDD